MLITQEYYEKKHLFRFERNVQFVDRKLAKKSALCSNFNKFSKFFLWESFLKSRSRLWSCRPTAYIQICNFFRICPLLWETMINWSQRIRRLHQNHFFLLSEKYYLAKIFVIYFYVIRQLSSFAEAGYNFVYLFLRFRLSWGRGSLE